jgi:tricorn protease
VSDVSHHHDKDRRLWIYDVEKKTQTKVAEALDGDFADVQWSPDSRWLAFDVPGPNELSRISICEAATGRVTPVTSDRYDSQGAAWSTDGKWLYFLSDRQFESVVGSPWGSRQPEPFFDKQTKIYGLALKKGARSPFAPDDELHAPQKDDKDEKKPETKDDQERAQSKTETKDPGRTGVPPVTKVQPAAKPATKPGASPVETTKDEAKDAKKAVKVDIDFAGIESRLVEVPAPAGAG